MYRVPRWVTKALKVLHKLEKKVTSYIIESAE